MLLYFLITLHFSMLSHSAVKKHAKLQKNPPHCTEIELKGQMVNYVPAATHWAIFQLGTSTFTVSEIQQGLRTPHK